MGATFADLVRAARAAIRELSVEELDEMIEDHQRPLIVDAREPDEHARGHIPTALLVPRGVLERAADAHEAQHDERLSAARTRPVVLYCDDGQRSALATARLQEMGFEQVYSLAGGLEGWRAAGLPVIVD